MIPKRKSPSRETLRTSYDRVWREREDLAAEVRMLRAELEGERANQEKLERRLRNTLVFAENAAEKLREKTREESEATLRKARARAEELVAGAEKTRSDLERQARELERHIAMRKRSAEQAAAARDAETQRRIERLLSEAEARAEEIVRSAERRRDEVDAEIDRTRAGYREFLGALERLAKEAGEAKAPALRAEEAGRDAVPPQSLPAPLPVPESPAGAERGRP